MEVSLTTSKFITKARGVHGDWYDYSKVVYKGCNIEVTIVCPKHGEFKQKPVNHTRGQGCVECGKERKRNNLVWDTSRFVTEARKVHGSKYNYSKVNYISSTQFITIICSKHGEFTQRPVQHIRGNGCTKCGLEVKRIHPHFYGTDKFVKEAKHVHGDKYDYARVVYKNARGKVKIICPEHGEFKQPPTDHLKGKGCKACADKERGSKKAKEFRDTFVGRASKLHNSKYEYSMNSFAGSSVKMSIVCPVHGVFYQTPAGHLSGRGCPYCGQEATHDKQRNKLVEVKQRFVKTHGDRYDYSKVKYIGLNKKVKIVCYKHGEFEQQPIAHINGVGCPQCKVSHGETAVRRYLEDQGIDYIYNWTNHDCILSKRPAKFDFYLPEYKVIIEYDGAQHYRPVRFGGNSMTDEDMFRVFDFIMFSDNKKNEWAKVNGYYMIRIRYDEEVVAVLEDELRPLLPGGDSDLRKAVLSRWKLQIS